MYLAAEHKQTRQPHAFITSSDRTISILQAAVIGDIVATAVYQRMVVMPRIPLLFLSLAKQQDVTKTFPKIRIYALWNVFCAPVCYICSLLCFGYWTGPYTPALSSQVTDPLRLFSRHFLYFRYVSLCFCSRKSFLFNKCPSARIAFFITILPYLICPCFHCC